jgi:glucose-1-phosphate thymidylyltransferase
VAKITDIVGVIPMAGRATRMGDLPCSKEILPVLDPRNPTASPRPVGAYLLERMREAGARKAFLVLREGKWDIAETFGDGSELGLPLSYLLVYRPEGPAYTIAQARPFAGDSVVLLGFPDILFEPADAYPRLLDHLAASSADVVLGLLPTDRPEKMDMVALEASGRVTAIDIKPARTKLDYAWILAVWTPRFSDFLGEYLERLDAAMVRTPLGREIHIGEVFQAAIGAGLHVSSVPFPHGRCLDIGTPDDLARAGGSEG